MKGRAKDLPLVEALAGRSPGENIPLLLDVARRQTGRLRPADLRAQHDRDAFVHPSTVDLRTTLRFDAVALEAAHDHEAILLSPLAPLGACAVVSPTVQDRVVTTLRGTEVVSDPTNVMAIECAKRLAKNPTSDVRLCTIHQVVRAQRFVARRGLTQHFRLFALAEAGLARPDHGFEVDAVVRLLQVFVRFTDRCAAHGSRFEHRRVSLLVADTSSARAIADRVAARLARGMPELAITNGTLASDYYDGLRVLFDATNAAGVEMNVGDIGLFDWVGKLTSNRRMRFAAAGLGIQLAASAFAEG
jgi:hypothetical protein